jgi:flagellar hook-length control protein FliK
MSDILLPVQTAQPAATGSASQPAASSAPDADNGTFPALFGAVINGEIKPQATEISGIFKDILSPTQDPDANTGNAVATALKGSMQSLKDGTLKTADDSEPGETGTTDGNILPLALPLAESRPQQPAKALSAGNEPDSGVLPAVLSDTEAGRRQQPLQASALLKTATGDNNASGQIADSAGLTNNAEQQKSLLGQLLAAQQTAKNNQGEAEPTNRGQHDTQRDSLSAVSTEWRANGMRTGSDVAAADKAAVPELRMDQRMGSSGWNSELGNRIVWMTRNDQQLARIRLNPPHMGPIEVKVSVHQDSANIVFSAHHAPARDAIEAAIPRLREMMAEQGFGSTNVDISGQGASGHEQKAASGNGTMTSGPEAGEVNDAEHADVVTDTSTGTASAANNAMVDYFV